MNIKSGMTDDFIRTQARIVDAEINGKLAVVFEDWIDVMNGVIDTPSTIVDIATLMTAGRIEKTKYAVNDAGKSVPNPYGVSLEEDGRNMLDGIVNGSMSSLGLKRFNPFTEIHEEGTFTPVGGLRTQEPQDRFANYRISSDQIGRNR